MSLLDRITGIFKRTGKGVTQDVAQTTSDEMARPSIPSELARLMSAETERRRVVLACREMYKSDPRAKRIVSTLSRDAVRGGFTVKCPGNKRAEDIARAMVRRLDLASELVKWLRLGFRDGDLFLELGINGSNEIAQITRKPTLQMRRNSNPADRFDDPLRAFWWADPMWMGMEPPQDAVWFAEWQIVHARWDHDEESRYGAPLFSSSTGPFKRMREGEVDIAVRRKTRAGMKYVHVLEGASEPELAKYKEFNKAALDDPFAAVADFFMNKEGGITAVQGDARLQEIADVLHHVRTWWTASPVPMSLIGYGQDLNRDVLDKQKEQYDEELDPVTQWVEDEILEPLLERQWLLMGILPEGLDYEVEWTAKGKLKAADLRDVADAVLRLKAIGFTPDVIVSILTRFLPGIDLSVLMETGAGGTGLAPTGQGNDAGRVAQAGNELGAGV